MGYCYFEGSSKRCVVNATLQCESVIQQYQRAEDKLGNAVDTISGKVDTINNHIDKAIEDAPAKLKVSVNVSDDDWQKIQELPYLVTVEIRPVHVMRVNLDAVLIQKQLCEYRLLTGNTDRRCG